MSPHPPADTLPLAGRAGEGGATRPGLAQKLRATPAPAEVRLWRILHAFRTNGFHFRKQVQLGPYVADFACLHAGIVIEVDGDTHGSDTARSNDASRDDYLIGRGFTVLRFSNHDVMTNDNGVFLAIEAALQDRTQNHRGAPPLPSSPARGEVSAASSPNLSDTLPLARRAGAGGAPRANPDKGTI